MQLQDLLRWARANANEEKKENSDVVIANQPTLYPKRKIHALIETLKRRDLFASGSFSKIYRISYFRYENNRYNPEIYALMVANKKKGSREHLEKAYTILQSCDHPNILKVFQMVINKKNCAVVMEFAKTDLYKKALKEKALKCEHIARKYFKQIVSAVAYLHKKGIAHRDIKPENILLMEDDQIKLADFGFAGKYDEDKDSVRGSHNYVSPETLRREVKDSRRADHWALGITLYAMLQGVEPFNSPTPNRILLNIINRKPFIHHLSASNEAKDLITKLLNKDPENRLGSRNCCEEILSHPWMQEQTISEEKIA